MSFTSNISSTLKSFQMKRKVSKESNDALRLMSNGKEFYSFDPSKHIPRKHEGL